MNLFQSAHSSVALALFWSMFTEAQAIAANTNQFGNLNGIVIDARTGKSSPCTVTIVDANGKRVVETESFSGGFRCDGHFTKRLPVGRTSLRVSRGFEVRAVEQTIEIPADQSVQVTIPLERIVDLRQRGWYGGDSHVHMNHGEKTIPTDFDYVALTARAEDLQYMSLAQSWTLENPTPERLEAELGSRSRPECLLTWNLEAPKNYYRGDAGRCLGHCWMLGVRGRTGEGVNVIDALLRASAHDYESEKPSYANFESHQLIHDQGGAVFYSHPARWWTGSWGGQSGYPRQERMRVSNMAVELPLDTLIGPTYDGLDLITGPAEFEANEMSFKLWCLLLNHGYRLAGTGSSDACFDRVGGGIPGVVRTYTYVGKDFSLPKVTRATAQGATFVSSGPLLLVTEEGRPPGSVFRADGKSRRLRIEAWPSGTDSQGLTRVELLRNGQPVLTNLFSPPVLSFKTNLPLADVESAWYCVRAYGCDPQRQRAISGAFYFESKDRPVPSAVPCRVRVKLLDISTGEKMAGSVSEDSFYGTISHLGKKHPVRDGEAIVAIAGTTRLRAEASGYESQTLSPFLDNPGLLDFITGLSTEDLVNWETFERVRGLLGETTLTFHLRKRSGLK